MLEKIFESLFVKSHIVTILPVIFGLVSALVLFFIASYDVLKVILYTCRHFFNAGIKIDLREGVVALIIGAVDLYLIALTLFVFSFGVYELLISKIEEFKRTKQSKVLEVYSLDQLKDKLARVVIMVLVVNFFQKVLQMKFTTPTDMAFLTGSILTLCVGLYFLHKGGYWGLIIFFQYN